VSDQKPTIEVFNLTDVPTESLKAYGLLSQQIVVGEDLVGPGASVKVPDEASTRAKLQHLLSVGAVALDKLPPEYVVAKAGPQPVRGPEAPTDRPLSVDLKTDVSVEADSVDVRPSKRR
jgi:hypothetical protein